MARKITIRRVGGLLPAICLVVLVLLAGILTWLSTAGLPGFVLRSLEEKAAREGIYLHIDKLRLAPSAGLALRAHGVVLYAEPEDSAPIARIHKATVGFSLSSLFCGEFTPHMVDVYKAEAFLPCSEAGQTLRLTEGNFAATIHESGLLQITSAGLKIDGIPLRLHGSCHLPESGQEEAESGESEPISIREQLRPWQKHIDAVHSTIAAQEWNEENRPYAELSISDSHGLQLSARATMPQFDYQQFHVREAALDIVYQQNSIIINELRFDTIEPESSMTIRGGYDIAHRHLSFTLESSAALARMAESFDIPEANEWLARYRHGDDNPPSINLRGELRLEEDFSPRSIDVRGRLQQENFSYGNTQVEEMNLSFFYQDGNFNISALEFRFPQGRLHISASASGEKGTGRAEVTLNMEVERLMGIINEFTDEPLTLPDDLILNGNLYVYTDATLSMPTFVPGQTDWRHYVPSLRTLTLDLSIDKAGHKDCELKAPALHLQMQGIRHNENLIPEAVDNSTLTLSADAAVIPLGRGKQPLALEGARMALHLADMDVRGESPTLGKLNGKLNLSRLRVNDLNSEQINLELIELQDIRPLEQNWRKLLTQGSLNIATDALRSHDTMLGSVAASLNLDSEGHIDFCLGVKRDGNELLLDLHPELHEDGKLVLENVALELPVAAFAPLLALTQVEIPYFRIPESISLTGSTCIDTNKGQLLSADATLSIPHLLRTPGTENKALLGQEIPLALHATLRADGRADGDVDMKGQLTLTHKAGTASKPDDRRMVLDYRANSCGLIHLSGSSSMDVSTINAIVDHRDAHPVLRDFRTGRDTRTHVTITSADIDCRQGFDVRASCVMDMSNFDYQLGAVEELTDAQGKPTGEERLRRDLGPDPYTRFSRITGKVDIHRRKRYTNEQGERLGDVSLVTMHDVELTYDNRPWQRRKRIKGGPRESKLRGDKVIIDVENSFAEIFNIKGKVYPAYSLGAFYDDLYGFMEMADIPRPASLESEHCLFPIYDDCKRKTEGCIRMLAREANFKFLGTTFPLRAFSGFIWLREHSVYLDKLNAACWEGALDAAVNIDYSGKRTAFDGYAKVRNMNLKPLAASYGSKQASALCNGEIRFRAPTPDLNDIEAYGELHIVNGDLMNLRIFRPVAELIIDLPGYFSRLEKEANAHPGKKPGWISRRASALFRSTGDLIDDVGDGIGSATNNIPFANHFLRYDLQEVHGGFIIDRGWLRTRGLKALGYNLNVSLRLTINLDTLEIQGNIWPKISSVPTILLSPLTFLSKYVVDINIYGTVEDLQWRFGLDKRLQYSDAPDSSATDKPADSNFKPRRP